eukprot:3296330-Amphidinium_carterae.1
MLSVASQKRLVIYILASFMQKVSRLVIYTSFRDLPFQTACPARDLHAQKRCKSGVERVKERG